MCPAVVQDPHLGEGDVYYDDGGPDKVYGVDGALGVMVVLIRLLHFPFVGWRSACPFRNHDRHSSPGDAPCVKL